jgi:hypothetical protein
MEWVFKSLDKKIKLKPFFEYVFFGSHPELYPGSRKLEHAWIQALVPDWFLFGMKI